MTGCPEARKRANGSIEPGGKGLTMVFTGNGKGKTTAALGLALRAVGQGLSVKMIQFIKSDRRYGEVKAAGRLAPDLEILSMGRGFVFCSDDPQDPALQEHIRAAMAALSTAREMIVSGSCQMLILDEILYALRAGLVSLADVRGLMALKPVGLHLVLTGRDAPPEIVDAADLVTEMCEVKHPMSCGVAAQRGIEF